MTNGGENDAKHLDINLAAGGIKYRMTVFCEFLSNEAPKTDSKTFTSKSNEGATYAITVIPGSFVASEQYADINKKGVCYFAQKLGL